MATPLLATKIGIPPLPHQCVQRNRLLDALGRGIPGHKLTLISAAAGYGKTTLLAQLAHQTRHPVAWLSLDDGDNDVERFFHYLFAAWEQVQPQVTNSPLDTLLAAMAPDSEAVISAFINLGQEIDEPTVFVLDDFHLIVERSIHDALTHLLDHLPHSLHFALSTRAEPALPLARYRARQELLSFGAQELSFALQETERFLNNRMGLNLARDDVQGLQNQLEGWVAGLQLAALSFKKGLASTQPLLVAGRQRFIVDYLSDEVLEQAPEALQRFLLQTSILQRLSAPLCNALTGKAHGQEMLERLENDNLFLTPMDDHRTWFRYHPIFAGFLQEELQRRQPEHLPRLHQRAAGWYLSQDMPDPAFEHAVAAGDADLAVEIFERFSQIKLTGGEFNVLRQWLNAIPETWHRDHVEFGLLRTGLLLFTGQVDACVSCIEEVEQQVASTERRDRAAELARVYAVRCSIARFQNDLVQARRLADEALRDLPDNDLLFRAMIYGSLGDTYRSNGRWREARDCYVEMLEFIQEPAFRVQAALVYGALADLELRQGKLHDAATYWKRALRAIEDPENRGRLPLPLIGWVYIRTAELLYERNNLADAWNHLSQGLERAELGGDVRAMIAGYLIAGRLRLTEGDADAATEYLEKARPFVNKSHFTHWLSRFERLQLEVWLEQDRLRAAVHWSDDMLQEEALEDRPESEVARLAMARVLIVKGDAPALEQALALLETLLRAAQAEGRESVIIEAFALQALARVRLNDLTGALVSLQDALRRAEPQGYVRLFADLGLPMGRLLQEARSRKLMPDYVETLLASFNTGTFPAPEQQTPPEPLTDREVQVLELIAAGLTNREIGDELVISPLTVKKHAANIYGKLSVSSRTEAAARARDLELLD